MAFRSTDEDDDVVWGRRKIMVNRGVCWFSIISIRVPGSLNLQCNRGKKLSLRFFSSNMYSGTKSPGAATASSNMKKSDSMAKLHIKLSSPPLYFMLQLTAAAQGMSMPLFMLLKY